MLASKTFVNLPFILCCYVFQEAFELFHETHVATVKAKYSHSPQPAPAGCVEAAHVGANEESIVNSTLLPLHVAQRLNFSGQDQIMLCENSHLGPKATG